MTKMMTDAPRLFLDWCAKVNVEPTRRQYKKWVRGVGQAATAAARRAGHDKTLRKALAGGVKP